MVKDFSEPAFRCRDYSFLEACQNKNSSDLYFPVEDARRATGVYYKSERIDYIDGPLASEEDSVVSVPTMTLLMTHSRAIQLRFYHFDLNTPFANFLHREVPDLASIRTEARKFLGLCVFNKDSFYVYLEQHCPNIYEQFKRYEALSELYDTLTYSKEQEELLLQLSTAH